MRTALRLAAALSVPLLLVSGCTSVPPPRPSPAPPPVAASPIRTIPGPTAPPAPVVESEEGAVIVGAAAALIGTPYHFGGADAAGFDCSGLAVYVYGRVGLAIPRTAAEQQRAARPVPLDELAPGDLVFFHMRSHHVDHVGIYAGAGRFIHAPRRGLAVSYGDLSHGYYAHRLVSAGRFAPPAQR